MKHIALGEAAEVLAGFAFKSQCFNSAGTGLPLVRMRDVRGGTTETFYDGPYDEKYVVRRGDLLVALSGTISSGRWQSAPALLNQRVCRLNPDSQQLDARYLQHFLPQALERLEAETPLMTVKNLSMKQIRGVEIPLPPIAEQRRIAAVLDAADELRAKRRQALAKLDTLTKAIFIDMFGDPLRNPREWATVAVGQLGEVSTGRTPPGDMEGMFGVEVPFVTPGDLESGVVVKRWLSSAGADHVRTVRAGSTLVCCIGATIGKVGIAESESAFNQQINAVDWHRDSVVPAFGTQTMSFLSREIARLGASTTMPILKKSSFAKLCIPVPPLALQSEFAGKAESYRVLRASLDDQQYKLDILFGSLQQRAFRGEL